MNEQEELARRIAKLLDESADQVGPAQRERLSAARRQALAAYRQPTARAWVPAWATSRSQFTDRRLTDVRYLLPVAALILGLLGIAYMHAGPTSEIADIDAGLLTDELPINAYLDQGFDSWLKRSPR
jgi:Protein of unknown function (DUF3619)